MFRNVVKCRKVWSRIKRTNALNQCGDTAGACTYILRGGGVCSTSKGIKRVRGTGSTTHHQWQCGIALSQLVIRRRTNFTWMH